MFKLNKEKVEKSIQKVPADISSLQTLTNTNKAKFQIASTQIRTSNVIEKGARLSDKDQLLFCQADSIVSLIISTRANQASDFGKRSKNKYERGYIARDLEPTRNKIGESREEIENTIAFKDALVQEVYKWLAQCGSANMRVKDAVFQGTDEYFKNCTLKEFLGAQARNLLATGRMATQLIRNKENMIVMFRPVPVESIFPYKKGEPLQIADSDIEITEQAKEDARAYNAMRPEERPSIWVQRIDGRIVSIFSEYDLRVDFLQKQAQLNLNGFPLSPLELAINALSSHMSAQQYMNNSFTKGLGSKGFLKISPLPGYEMDALPTREEMDQIRKEFQNYLAGSYNNSAIIPVIAGNMNVDFVDLNMTAKDMEFLNLYNYVIAILCSSFGIAPEEVGFNGTGTKTSLGDEGNQSQIVQGQERGLVQLMNVLFSAITDIVHEVFPQTQGVISIEPIGLGQNTQMSDTQLYKEQLQTSATMGKIWADSEHPETFPFGGDIPTCPLFHSGVAKYMKYAEFRYYFLKDSTALENKDYDFIIDPALNASYFQLKYAQQQAVPEETGYSASDVKSLFGNVPPTSHEVKSLFGKVDGEHPPDEAKKLLSSVPPTGEEARTLLDKVEKKKHSPSEVKNLFGKVGKERIERSGYETEENTAAPEAFNVVHTPKNI